MKAYVSKTRLVNYPCIKEKKKGDVGQRRATKLTHKKKCHTRINYDQYGKQNIP